MTDVPLGKVPPHDHPHLPSEASAKEGVPSAPKRSLGKKLLKLFLWGAAVLVSLVLVAAFAGPQIAAKIVTSKAREMFRAQTNGELEIAGLSLSLKGQAVLDKLKVTSADQKPLVEVARVEARIDIWKALQQAYNIELILEKPVVEIRRDADGRTNLETLLRETTKSHEAPSHESPSPDALAEPKPANSLPSVKAHVVLRDGSVVLEDAASGRRTELKNINLDFSVPDLGQPSELTLKCSVGDTPIEVSGRFTFAKDGELKPTADLRYAFEQLALEALDGLVALIDPATRVSGMLSAKGTFSTENPPATTRRVFPPSRRGAKGTFSTENPPAAEISGEWSAKNLVLDSPASGAEPIELEELSLRSRLSVDTNGAGELQFHVSSGTTLECVDGTLEGDLSATFEGALGENPSLRATIDLKSDLANLSRAAHGLLRLKQGYALEGSLSARAQVELASAQRKPSKIQIDAKLQGTGLLARDAEGQSLPLDPTLAVELSAGYDRTLGQIDVRNLVIQAEAIQAEARGSISGLAPGQAVSVRDSHAKVLANLDQLHQKLSRFVNVPPLGGKVELVADVSAGTEKADFDATMRLSNLSFAEKVPPTDATLLCRGVILPGEGQSTVTIEKAELHSDALNASLTGSIAKGQKFSADLEYSITAEPKALSSRLSGLVPEIEFSGSSLSIKGSLKGSQDDMLVTSRLAAKNFTLVQHEKREGKIGSRIVGPLSATAETEIQADEAGKVYKIRKFSVRSNPLDADLAGSLSREASDIQGGIVLRPGVFSQLFAAFLGGLVLEGQDVRLSGTAKGSLDKLQARAKLDLKELLVEAPGDKEVRAIRDTALEITADLRREAATSRPKTMVDAFSAVGPGLEVHGNAWFGASWGASVQAVVGAGKVVELAGGLLGGLRLEGDPISLEADVQAQGSSISSKGSAKSKSFSLRGGRLGEAGIAQRDLTTAWDLSYTDGLLSIREGKVQSMTASLEASGTVRKDGSQADISGHAKGELGTITRDLAGLMKLPEGFSLRGALDAKVAYRGSEFDSKITVGGLEVRTTALPDPVREPEVRVDAKFTIDHGQELVTVRQCQIDANLLRGSLKGEIRGFQEPEFRDLDLDLTYVPESLGALLSPFLGPVRLEGKEPEKVSARLSGKARGSDPMALLRGTRGQATIGIGTVRAQGLVLAGTVDAKLDRSKLRLRGPLQVNGGQAELDAEVDLREAVEKPRSRMVLKSKDVGLNTETKRLLEKLHPLFADVSATLDGQATTDLEFAWDGPVDPQSLREAGRLAPTSLRASGSLGIQNLLVKGSDFLLDILRELEQERQSMQGELVLPELRVGDGKVSYEELTLRLSRYSIHFSGEIQFDGRLRLLMTVPMTEHFLSKYPKLVQYAGDTLPVPIAGTLQSPHIDWAGAVEKLLEKAIERTVEDAIERGLERFLKKKKKKGD